MFEIKKAGPEQAQILRRLAIQTFIEAYSAFNTKEDMEAYLEKSFSPQAVTREMDEEGTDFFICYSGGMAVGYTKLNYDKACEAIDSSRVTELQRIYVLRDWYGQKAGK